VVPHIVIDPISKINRELFFGIFESLAKVGTTNTIDVYCFQLQDHVVVISENELVISKKKKRKEKDIGFFD
jgi:SepF-like predicted cell division protein (DUF552 family)